MSLGLQIIHGFNHLKLEYKIKLILGSPTIKV